MTDGGCLMAVDGTGLYVRCSKAAAHARMTGPDGTPTGTLVLFANSLASMVRQIRPRYLLIAWDGGNGTAWRRKICPEYKANRTPAEYYPRDTREFDAVREFCSAAQITQWCLDEFEGDDMLAAASRLAVRDLPDTQVVLCSDDADVLQLCADRIWARYLGADGSFSDADRVRDHWGVEPGNLPMLRALAGDASDGIPGLPGTGLFRALQLLRHYEFCWPLPKEAVPDPAKYAQVLAWHDVMNLNRPPKSPEDHDEHGVLNILQTEWTPGNILPVLEKYGMRRMAEKVVKDTLW
jgi:DNA polymerase I